MPINTGYPRLVERIAQEIGTSGPITFARFMELALYHAEFGYYMRERDVPDATQEPMEHRIGWNGDFYTSSDVHPILARCLARQIGQVDDLLGRPDPFVLVEMGPGKGLLARDFLADCAEHAPDFFRRLQYVLIERSPAMRNAQEANVSAHMPHVSWAEGLASLSPRSVVGAVLSNELVDAFPVHRIKMTARGASELLVDVREDRFCEREGPISTRDLDVYVARLAGLGIELAEGQIAEINLEAIRWMREVARVLEQGIVLTIDYGHTAQDLYGPERRRGTLLCYRDQMVSEDPYRHVGLQDMTAHVDFSSLASAGEEAGLSVTGFTNQMSFLMGLGVEELIERLEPGSPEFQAVIHLLRPEGMGRTFKILVQHKGMTRPELDGLRYKPFWGTALTPASGERAVSSASGG